MNSTPPFISTNYSMSCLGFGGCCTYFFCFHEQCHYVMLHQTMFKDLTQEVHNENLETHPNMLLVDTYTCFNPFSYAWRHPSHHAKICPTSILTIQQILKILTPKLHNRKSANCCPPLNFHTPTTNGKNNTIPCFHLLQHSMQSNDVQL